MHCIRTGVAATEPYFKHGYVHVIHYLVVAISGIIFGRFVLNLQYTIRVSSDLPIYLSLE